MTVTDPKEGVKKIVFKSGLTVYVKDDGCVAIGDIIIKNDEFRTMAAIRHALKN